MSDSTHDRGLVERLAEEFVARCRAGERPTVDAYATAHPEHADEIRALFPALLLAEEPGPGDGPAVALGRVGDFRIVREVGRGGMGVVYEAVQESLGRRVALKMLPRTGPADEPVRRRFEREARAAARLHHTNIVPVFGVGEHDGRPYYVMQLIPGRGLNDVLAGLKRLRPGGANAGPPSAADLASTLLTGEFRPAAEDAPPAAPAAPVVLPGQGGDGRRQGGRPPTYWQSVAALGAQVADALAYAHQQGVLHRDVKPSNLLLDAHGMVWVTDFGLAKVEDQPNLTGTGDVVGTLRYLPPEAFDGRTDSRSDVYSLGLTLYELLAFRPAFDERDRAKLVRQVTEAAPPRLRRLNPAVPRDLETVVHKAIERDPRHRYPTAGELAADLQRFLDDQPIRARRLSRAEWLGRQVRRHKALSAALAAVALLLLVLVVGAVVAAVYNGRLADRARKGQQAADEARGLEAQRSEQLRRFLYLAQMRQGGLTEKSWFGLVQLRELLPRWRREGPDLRGWEWYYLNAPLHRQLLAVGFGEGAGPRAVGWSADGTRLEVFGQDHVRTLDAVTGKEVALRRWKVSAPDLALSPDGTRLALGCRDGTVRVLDFSTGEELFARRGNVPPGAATKTVRVADPAEAKEQAVQTTASQVAVAWSPKGDRLAAASMIDGTVRLFRAATGEETLRLVGHVNGARSAAWAPDGARLVTVAGDGVARVLDASTGQEAFALRPDAAGPVRGQAWSAAWAPDGARLALGDGDGRVRIRDGKSGRGVADYRGHSGHVVRVAWSPDGARLASVGLGDECAARVWSSTGSLALLGHESIVTTAAWSPDGARLATVGADGTVRVWDAGGPGEEITLRGPAEVPSQVAWSPDARRLAVVGTTGPLRVLDSATGEEAFHFALPGGGGLDRQVIAWTPDGDRLASAGGGRVHFWDAATGKLARTPRESGSPAGAAWRLAWSDRDGQVHVYDAATGEEPRTLALRLPGKGDRVNAVALSPDGTRLASGHHDGTVYLWDASTGRRAGDLRGHSGGVLALAWAPDGKRLASGGFDGTVRVWETPPDGGREVHILRGHPQAVFSVAWSPDGQRLASGGNDPVVRIWDPEAGQEALALRGEGDRVHDVAWSPDGTRVACAWLTLRGKIDGAVRVHDATPGYSAEAPEVLPVADDPVGLRRGAHVLRYRAGRWRRLGRPGQAEQDERQARALEDRARAWKPAPK